MEQSIGTPPFRYEVTGDDAARIVEFQRNSLVGSWRRVDDGRRLLGRWRKAVPNQRWVSCRATVADTGTLLEVEASRGRGALPRALQFIGVVSRGVSDQRTIYRSRHIPPGPVTLVASWSGMPYRLYEAPSREAPRSREVLTATRMVAVPGGNATFVKVRLSDGHEGYVERDEIVSATDRATREAGELAARNV
jgi:hypothetical protein